MLTWSLLLLASMTFLLQEISKVSLHLFWFDKRFQGISFYQKIYDDEKSEQMFSKFLFFFFFFFSFSISTINLWVQSHILLHQSNKIYVRKSKSRWRRNRQFSLNSFKFFFMHIEWNGKKKYMCYNKNPCIYWTVLLNKLYNYYIYILVLHTNQYNLLVLFLLCGSTTTNFEGNTPQTTT